MREIRISYIHRLRPTIPPLRGIAKEFSSKLLLTLWPAATAVVCPPTFPPQEEVAIALWSPHEATINILTAAANQGRGEKGPLPSSQTGKYQKLRISGDINPAHRYYCHAAKP
ncbi:unnamed protein product [Sphagnum jensenii]|uniref:Uncharacterized protein n=1 Tax=Sphagnum jensenii TaxID=128206 RepID=A0ABP1BAD9_9BRYO